MIFKVTGEAVPGFYITGTSWSPVCLLDGPVPTLFEGGIAMAAPLYLRSIAEILKGRTPESIFLTHVHWDHCGAIGPLRDAYPSLRIRASRRASEIVRRPNAIRLMAELNRDAKKRIGDVPGVDPEDVEGIGFRPFQVDEVLEDGRIIPLGPDLSVRVIATPGHTRDHLSYFIPEKGILIASEASGCIDARGAMIPEFLVDYDGYISSVKKLAALDAEVLYQGHRYVFVGRSDVRRFFERSLAETEEFRDHVLSLLKEADGAAGPVVTRIKAEMWDPNPGPKQPEAPYLLNLRAQVAHLARRLLKTPHAPQKGQTPPGSV
jgi:2-aminobenzoylacetyl-CoA thioesterase